MTPGVHSDPLRETDADVLAVAFGEGSTASQAAATVASHLNVELKALLEQTGTPAQRGGVLLLPSLGRLRAAYVAYVFVDDSVSPSDPTALREAALTLGRHTRPFQRIAVALIEPGREVAGAFAAVLEGFDLGRFAFGRYKTEGHHDPAPAELVFVNCDPPGDLDAIRRHSSTVSNAVSWVRSVVERPPAEKPPLVFARESAGLLDGHGYATRVWSDDELALEGFNGIVAVGSGSANPPAMLEATLSLGGEAAPQIALVGKGITFDSGGLDLKDVNVQVHMKNDLGGAAAVVAAAVAAAELALPLNLLVLVPLAENMPSGTAYRPSDVIKQRNGLTTEVMSPDGEGRIVLADALSYAVEQGADVIVDVATLTGDYALGEDIWAALGTDRALLAELLAAGEATGDRGWELPLWKPYRTHLDSIVADQRNNGPTIRYNVGTIVAALFLERFVGAVPWAHLDIAATATRDSESAVWPAGATGSATAPLIHWLEARARQHGS